LSLSVLFTSLSQGSMSSNTPGWETAYPTWRANLFHDLGFYLGFLVVVGPHVLSRSVLTWAAWWRLPLTRLLPSRCPRCWSLIVWYWSHSRWQSGPVYFFRRRLCPTTRHRIHGWPFWLMSRLEVNGNSKRRNNL
jgi:hypothetical protein